MAGVFEIVGAVASVLQLAGFARYLLKKAFDVASKSGVETKGWHRFVRYLNVVEILVKPYMNPVWQGNDAMIVVMEAVKLELEGAWNLVSRLLARNRVWRWFRAGRFAKKLKQSQAEIERFLSHIQMAANGEPPVPTSLSQVGDAHSGNEDLDHAIALSLFLGEYLTANRIDSSYQVHAVEEFARAQQESIGSPQLSNQSIPWDIRGSSQVEDDDNDEELARAIQASFDSGSPPN